MCKNSSNMQSSLTSTATKSNSSLPTLLSSEQNQKAGIAKSPPSETQDGATLETSINMDTFSDGANTKFLEEENLKLKEQRLCKVNIWKNNNFKSVKRSAVLVPYLSRL